VGWPRGWRHGCTVAGDGWTDGWRGDGLISGREVLCGLRGLWVLGEGAANRRGWWLC
jgi:hypothetical protein